MDSKATWFADKAGALLAAAGHNTPVVVCHQEGGYVARYLLPIEAERLQGFPENWTDVPANGVPAEDKYRYQALGNSMSVPVLRWIGERLRDVVAAQLSDPL